MSAAFDKRSSFRCKHSSITTTVGPIAMLVVLTIGVAMPAGASSRCIRGRARPLPRIHIVGQRLYSGRLPWRGWGLNWGAGSHEPVSHYFDEPTTANLEALACELVMARRLGANVMRIPLELGQIMQTATRTQPRALAALRTLLGIAAHEAIYLDLTGNLEWRRERSPDWYDRLPERARWNVQVVFWRAVAHVAHDSPAVLCYELTSEPLISDAPGWYTGEFGGRWFVQIIAHPRGRSPLLLARTWTRLLKAAVRSQDNRPVTIGMLPETKGGFTPSNVANLLDMLVVHIYPETGRSGEAVALLRHYASFHKPVLLGETFPLWCDLATQQAFLTYANPYVVGVMEFFDGRDPYDMTVTTIPDVIYQAGLVQFEGLRYLLTTPLR